MNNGIHRYVERAVEICVAKGIREFVVAPGSRSAPLTIAVARQPELTVRVIFDERSAGYVALGLAQQLQRPVGLICTSGTAAVNFTPAVVEAFYQQVPLLIFTADRPPEWIDQQDNQAIHQSGMYAPHVRASYVLPPDDSQADTAWYVTRLISEAVERAHAWPPGPVHINVPLREPLYPPSTHEPTFTDDLRLATVITTRPQLTDHAAQEIRSAWQNATRKLIVIGQYPFDTRLHAALKSLVSDPSVAIFADITANCFPNAAPLMFADIVLGSRDPKLLDALRPNLVVNFGGPITSKNLKQFLRRQVPIPLWRVQPDSPAPDTFQRLTHLIPMFPNDFVEQLERLPGNPTHDYANTWLAANTTAHEMLVDFLNGSPFGDFSAVAHVLQALPAGSLLQLGNSMPIRYANYLGVAPDHVPGSVNSNRGTSGIDGTVSTAVGAALATTSITTLVVGDLAFFYDRNGLWHTHLPPNLRIVLLNNHGGGIFDILDGPDRLPAELRKTFFLTPQPLSARRTAEDHGLDYYRATDLNSLQASLPAFYDVGQGPALLEIETDMATNRTVFQRFRARIGNLRMNP